MEEIQKASDEQQARAKAKKKSSKSSENKNEAGLLEVKGYNRGNPGYLEKPPTPLQRFWKRWKAEWFFWLIVGAGIGFVSFPAFMWIIGLWQ